jgi:two-component system phosphate regulon sensor histidine kinase PhoR
MITRPVRELTGAAHAVSAGDFSRRIRIQTSDEVGRLARAFNEMSRNLTQISTANREERIKLATVVSSLADGVVMTDSQAGIALMNPAAARLFNIPDTPVTGRPLIEVIADYEVQELFKKCLATGHEQSAEIYNLTGRFIRIIGVPLVGVGSGGALLLFQDLTQMRNLQTTRREFIANVSHELRTPLTSIKAIVETLQDGAIEDRKVAMDFLGKVEVEVDGMAQMATELIELSRIETGKEQLRLELVDINALCQEIMSRFAPQAERQKIALATSFEPGMALVEADRERIRQVITNIVHNAIKFTPAGGKAVISTVTRDGSVVVSVSDTGIGISKEDLPHIFERFFKTDRSRLSSGTGLGLAIAKHIVQAHGGTITVASEEGHGSTFSFSLPLKHTAS